MAHILNLYAYHEFISFEQTRYILFVAIMKIVKMDRIWHNVINQ